MAQDLHRFGLANTSSTHMSHMHEQRLGLSFLQSDALLHAIVEAFSAWRRKIANPMHCCTLSSKPFRLDAGRSNRVHTFDRVDCPLSASLHGDCLLPLLYLSGFRLPRPMQRYRCLGRRATVLPGGIGPDISGHCARKQDSFWSLLHRRKTRGDMMGEHLAKLHNFKLQPQCALGAMNGWT